VLAAYVRFLEALVAEAMRLVDDSRSCRLTALLSLESGREALAAFPLLEVAQQEVFRLAREWGEVRREVQALGLGDVVKRGSG